MRPIEKLTLFLQSTGFDPIKCREFFKYLPYFLQTYSKYKKIEKERNLSTKKILYPILSDLNQPAGSGFGHYFYQDLWAARKIYKIQPIEHVDVGSRVDGFIAHILTFTSVKLVDVRPLSCEISGLKFIHSDGTLLDNIPDNSVESLSSLHAVEHFGLGRYGDVIDPDACFTAMESFSRVLKPNGHLYFSVPIGEERTYFNAHRVFSPTTILSNFNNLKLISFSVIDDLGHYIENQNPEDYQNAKVACGLFEFTK